MLVPLDAAYDRRNFDCGEATLNHWFQRHALANQLEGVTRTVVLVDDAAIIMGYVSLCSGGVARAFFPKPFQRNRPDPVPVTLLAQLAVDRQFQRQGHSLDLLRYALTAAFEAHQKVGSAGLLTHPINDNARRFYVRWGFVDLPNDPKRSMFIRMVDARLP